MKSWLTLQARNQPLPRMTLITLIYTDQKSSVKTIFKFVNLSVCKSVSSVFIRGEICFFVQGRVEHSEPSVERFVVQVATIRSDFPQGHAGGQTARR
jgi:hypothetical protein